ncbi:Methyltransferase type 11 (modular protein) [Desulfamplus magnetovallimortis]|uniref:Methyltransferase type 11 (Modular protein) n=1 Tax=Desulfamplus magnetovallimortis TaxID=1246637 RepID=A0A1W1HC82_9BACT|nr:methyltransferase domain-containing protein [Desulfamplus magnetovallimortis]SLM29988.1 Methyltransferase type 11 (modular protein) [Desulfamplus magnetovallimortis]
MKDFINKIVEKIQPKALENAIKNRIHKQEDYQVISKSDNLLLENFIKKCRLINTPMVLELGTKRSVAGRSTRHDEWIPHAAEYIGTDIEPGADVDIVADVHRLSDFTGTEKFDVIISCSTFEHFKYPHLAAHEVMKALRINGLLFIQTHQTYPVHAYPNDYFRFSKEALEGLFGSRMGFNVIATDYEFPAQIYSDRVTSLSHDPAFLNSRLYGEKVSTTPENYIYELDSYYNVKNID